jgi:hypothetical protein
MNTLRGKYGVENFVDEEQMPQCYVVIPERGDFLVLSP